MAAVGDVDVLGGDFVEDRDNQSMLMHCSEAIGNPFLHMRLGQREFELGTWIEQPTHWLEPPWGSGEIFDGEEYF